MVKVSSSGAGIAIRMTRDEFDRLAAVGSYVSMQNLTQDGVEHSVVMALIIEEEEAA